jgi:RNA polymerase sigma-70 factor (ECF subfamily)
MIVEEVGNVGRRMKNDDGEIYRRWQLGEVSAFEALVHRWQDPIARFLARLLGNRAPVADLTQETFLRMYLSRARYREEGSFSTWLYQIALNLGRDWLRRKQREPQPLCDDVSMNDSTWERSELRELVETGLAALTPPLREVLVLRHYERMRFESMSRLLGVPASTLKSRFAVALRQMRQHLQSQGWTEEEATS